MKERKQWLTIREFSKLGILSEYAIRLLVKQKKIPHVVVGNRVLLNEDAVMEYLKESSLNQTERA